MSRKKFVGVIPPVLTLFTKEGEIDVKAQRTFLDFLIDKGVHSAFVGGTYGSSLLMTTAQRKQLFDITIDQVKGRIPVIAHVGAADTATTIELAKYAEKAGAQAVATVPPFFFQYPEKSIINFYKAVVDSVSIPVFAYNNPKATGVLITPNMTLEMAKVGLAGMKDSCMDIVPFVQTIDLMEKAKIDFEMIIGTEGIWAGAAVAGAKAMVAGLANVMPELVVEYYNVTINKGLAEMGKMQPKILRARNLMKLFATVPTCHAMLKLRGINSAYPKLPFEPLTDEQVEKVKKAMIVEGLL